VDAWQVEYNTRRPGHGHPRPAARPRPSRAAPRARAVASSRTGSRRFRLGDC
jgi:hypothetical protein